MTDIIDMIDETLSFYSAGLGEVVTVPVERPNVSDYWLGQMCEAAAQGLGPMAPAAVTIRRDLIVELASALDIPAVLLLTGHGAANHWSTVQDAVDQDMAETFGRMLIAEAQRGDGSWRPAQPDETPGELTPECPAVTEPDAHQAAPEPCCDFHNRNCEPPSELCCDQCTEAAHGFLGRHVDGSHCIAPDLSGYGPVEQP